jgi:ribosomal protein S18 acetylase RimI-like enzyme
MKDFFNIYLWATNCSILYPDASETFFQKVYMHELSLPDTRCCVADDDNRGIVGYFVSIKHGDFRHMAEGYIYPEFQRIGLGTKMWNFVMRDNNEQALSGESAVVDSKNQSGFSSALKMGLYNVNPIIWFARKTDEQSGFPRQEITSKEITENCDEFLKDINWLDKNNIGFTRECHHSFLTKSDAARLFAFIKGEDFVGYCYLWKNGLLGPFSYSPKVEPQQVLKCALQVVSECKTKYVSLGVGQGNIQAMDFLFSNSFRITDVDLFMSNYAALMFRNYFPMVGFTI